MIYTCELLIKLNGELNIKDGRIKTRARNREGFYIYIPIDISLKISDKD